MFKIFVYKTTNLINGKIYVGVHKCKHIKCKYLGSGYKLKNAIKKYGEHNFSREILSYFSTLEDAFIAEREIVNSDFIEDCNTYNISVGGIWGRLDEETRKRIGEKVSLALSGRKVSSETKYKIRETLTGHIQSEETKLKISNKLYGRTLTPEHKANIAKNTHFKVMSKESHDKTNLKNRGQKRTPEQIARIREGRWGKLKTL